MPACFAILDTGKTNVKITVAAADGRLLDSRSVANATHPGPPWRHHDLGGLSEWIGRTLADLCSAHGVSLIVPVGHGSGGVLAGEDPDRDGTGAALPMPDYEEPCPPAIDAGYRAAAGGFADRGSAVMMASTHAARQLWRMQAERPQAVAGARWYLNLPQYWAWWLSGVAASEYTAMGAQSGLWNVPARRWAGIVAARGWDRLMPPFHRADAMLGPVRPALARRFGLPEGVRVLTGAHDSSANFLRYLLAGLSGFTLVSTGTWIVALTRETDIAALDEARGMTINADPDGNPVGGALTMGGREFTALAGPGWNGAAADPAALRRLIAQGTMALPSFGENEGQFPGSAGRGRILGPPPADAAERSALAVLHMALLTAECAGSLGGGGRMVLDGTFLRDPTYAGLVAALTPGRTVETCAESYGVAAGAAALACTASGLPPAPPDLTPAAPCDLPGLDRYAEEWRARARADARDQRR